MLGRWVAAGRSVVHEHDTKALLAEAGIAVPRRDPAAGPCVVKIASDRYPHKTEHGLVRLGVPVAEAAAIGRDMRGARARRRAAHRGDGDRRRRRMDRRLPP